MFIIIKEPPGILIQAFPNLKSWPCKKQTHWKRESNPMGLKKSLFKLSPFNIYLRLKEDSFQKSPKQYQLNHPIVLAILPYTITCVISSIADVCAYNIIFNFFLTKNICIWLPLDIIFASLSAVFSYTLEKS